MSASKAAGTMVGVLLGVVIAALYGESIAKDASSGAKLATLLLGAFSALGSAPSSVPTTDGSGARPTPTARNSYEHAV